MMVVMDVSKVDWVTIATYENTLGCRQPLAAARA
jgi:hypothetical protein